MINYKLKITKLENKGVSYPSQWDAEAKEEFSNGIVIWYKLYIRFRSNWLYCEIVDTDHEKIKQVIKVSPHRAFLFVDTLLDRPEDDCSYMSEEEMKKRLAHILDF